MDDATYLPTDTAIDAEEVLRLAGILRPGDAMFVDWSFDEYLNANDFVSRSGLEELRVSPQRYYERHEARTLPQDPPSSQMVLGTHVHLATLEPTEWSRRLYPPEPGRPMNADGRAKRGTPEKDAYMSWRAQCIGWEAMKQPDSIVLSSGEREKAEAMARSVRSHAYGRLLLDSPGKVEQTILWRHAETGLCVRARLDRLIEIDADTQVILDLKTSTDPSPRAFGSSVAKFGYHRQAAMYVDAFTATGLLADVHYVLAVVRSAPPYEVAFYQLEARELELGRMQYEETMRDLVRRRETNDWRAPWQHGCASLNLPGWAYHEGT